MDPLFVAIGLTLGVAIMTLVSLRRHHNSRRKAAFESRLDSVLAHRFPDTERNIDDEELRISRGGDEACLPLRPLRQRLSSSDEVTRERALTHFLAETERALRRPTLADLDLEDARERIVPVLLPKQRAERTDRHRRVVLPLDEEIDIAFALDEPGTGEWLTETLLERWGVSAEELWPQSVENLWNRTEGAVVYQDDSPGREVYRVQVGDGLDASRALLQPLWRRVGEDCGSDLVLCMPARDRLYAAPVTQPASIDRMTEKLRSDWLRRPHSVSPRIWIWRDGKLAPWELHG